MRGQQGIDLILVLEGKRRPVRVRRSTVVQMLHRRQSCVITQAGVSTWMLDTITGAQPQQQKDTQASKKAAASTARTSRLHCTAPWWVWPWPCASFLRPPAASPRPMDPSVDSIGQNHPAFRPENGSGLAAAGQKAAAVVQRIRRWR